MLKAFCRSSAGAARCRVSISNIAPQASVRSFCIRLFAVLAARLQCSRPTDPNARAEAERFGNRATGVAKSLAYRDRPKLVLPVMLPEVKQRDFVGRVESKIEEIP